MRYLARLMESLEWLGASLHDETARSFSATAWRVSDQDALGAVLLELEERAPRWSVRAHGSPALADELRAATTIVGELRVAFFGDLLDRAKVVRGGITSADQLRRGVAEHRSVPGLVGFSVQSENGVSVDELARAARYPNAQISVTEVGRLRAAGSNVLPSPGSANHCTVVADADRAEALSAVFEQTPNPYRRGT